MTVVVSGETSSTSGGVTLSSRSISRSKANNMRFSSSRLRHSGASGSLGTSMHSSLGIN